MIRGYLRYRRSVFALYAAILVFFPVVQRLYGYGLEATGYALLLITFLLVAVGTVDFVRYRARVVQLDAIRENLSAAAHALPAAIGPIETRYRDIAVVLYQMIDDQAEDAGKLRAEQLDYYTMWMHQIKTPIAAMRLSLSNGVDPGVLEDELFKVERYVEMALQYVKMEKLADDLVIEEYQLTPILNAAVKKYASFFIGKRLKVEIENTDRVVATDSKWLSFIVEQLLSNAVKYTDKGSIRIFGEGNALIIQDTGVGIRQEDLRRIFQKGYTGYNGRIDHRASGLGLYMAKRVADQLGIRLYAESAFGHGTTMKLVFPKKESFLP